MTKTQAVEHFGSQMAIARALGIKGPSVVNWGERIPPLRQLQIERVTGGALKADDDILPAVEPAHE